MTAQRRHTPHQPHDTPYRPLGPPRVTQAQRTPAPLPHTRPLFRPAHSLSVIPAPSPSYSRLPLRHTRALPRVSRRAQHQRCTPPPSSFSPRSSATPAPPPVAPNLIWGPYGGGSSATAPSGLRHYSALPLRHTHASRGLRQLRSDRRSELGDRLERIRQHLQQPGLVADRPPQLLRLAQLAAGRLAGDQRRGGLTHAA